VPQKAAVISAADAEKIAASALQINDAVMTVPTSLIYIDDGLFGNSVSDPKLAWYIKISSPRASGHWTVVVDALSGDLLRQISDLHYVDQQVFGCQRKIARPMQ